MIACEYAGYQNCRVRDGNARKVHIVRINDDDPEGDGLDRPSQRAECGYRLDRDDAWVQVSAYSTDPEMCKTCVRNMRAAYVRAVASM